ncbi:MAG: hypothetical protein M3235_20835 [Actinomycetota bacterium]|nr:hypothetical protein [Actinomycetota bacterium]
MTRSLLDTAECTPFGEHDGRSGSTLERVRLADGTRLVLKRSGPDSDLVGRLTGATDRELTLFTTGVLDALPDGVGHAVLDAWRDGPDTLVLMRDVGADVPGWTRTLDRAQCRRILAAAAAQHDRFAGDRPDGLCDLATRLTLLWPHRMAPLADVPNPLPQAVLRGWRRFAELADRRAVRAVRALQTDPAPLVDALAGYPHTVVHGDLWPVNLALEAHQVTLLDWSAASWAPPVLEFAVYLTGSAGQVRATRDEIVADYRAIVRPDETALRLGFVAGLLELGWNKALDAAEHPDPRKRADERADLDWWLDAATPALFELGVR